MDEKVRGLLTQSHGLAHKHALENKDACAACTVRIILVKFERKKKEKQGEHRSRTLMGASKLPPRPRPVLNSDVHAACRRCDAVKISFNHRPEPRHGAHLCFVPNTWLDEDGWKRPNPSFTKQTNQHEFKAISLPLSLTDQSPRRQLGRSLFSPAIQALKFLSVPDWIFPC